MAQGTNAYGGAIYNLGSITFTGNNIFAGNTANGVLNDIYNIGTITISSGTTQLNSGYNGTDAGKLNISAGATFDLNENNGEIHTSALGIMKNSGTFNLGIDLASSTSYDKFTLASGSSGKITIIPARSRRNSVLWQNDTEYHWPRSIG